MVVDLFWKIIHIPVGGMPYAADYSVFLALGGIGPNFHGLVFWFLPLLLMFIVSDDVFTDKDTGSKSILAAKVGSRQYAMSVAVKGFLFSFALILLPLLFNLFLSHILLNGVKLTFDKELYGEFAKRCMEKPLLTNVVFIFITSLLAGVIGFSGSGLALVTLDRKKAYVISFLLWYVFFVPRKSIMLSLQPFSEYGLKDILPVYLLCLFTHVIIALICFAVARRRDVY